MRNLKCHLAPFTATAGIIGAVFNWRYMSNIALLTLLILSVTGQANSKHEIPAISIEVRNAPKTANLKPFLRLLPAEIEREWLKSTQSSLPFPHNEKAVLRFKVSRSGKLLNDEVIVQVSSGDPALDKALVAAIRDAAPFAGFPRSFRGSSIECRVTFNDQDERGIIN